MLIVDTMKISMDGFGLHGSLSLPQGARAAILGPSGAGKSTFLAALAGFQPLASGQITWQGTKLPTRPSERPISMVFQDNNLFPHLSVAENVGLGLRPDLKLSSEDLHRVEQALDRVGLSGLGGRKPAQLSGGQIARVALARVLLRNQPLLLLDEPFGALGPALKSEMLALVEELLDETGATLLMVSHNPQDARAICDQVVLVAEGKLHPAVTTDEIFAHPPEALRDYLGH
ncbi:ATP-binding cassette domain-containing protein [Aliiroseovarius crassostreae]|uniref:thiamine ABC transporter ATP-binding protein n=1 Tax=Aliiroseovarius crassostreae TaxID=154981 RepID=UPI0021AF0EE8|nr:ATP-binding cassette domain-containing protein [Aliiroseovarius crassostreae]UWQ11062.1 ATP-binding cassette domain-containing protein [Aliiroseovarius crassostreae]